MTLRALNYASYGLFHIIGNAGFISPTVLTYTCYTLLARKPLIPQ